MAEKHPPGRVAAADTLVESGCADPPCYDPILFEQLTGDLIKGAALRTHGAAGPSGVDAYAWRRLCSSFGSASVALCNSLTAVARRLCIQDVDSAELMAFVACRRISLDKKPGVRPIGIGDVPIGGLLLRLFSMSLVLIPSWQPGLCRHVQVTMPVRKLLFMLSNLF